jgi:hypothetical protein
MNTRIHVNLAFGAVVLTSGSALATNPETATDCPATAS